MVRRIHSLVQELVELLGSVDHWGEAPVPGHPADVVLGAAQVLGDARHHAALPPVHTPHATSHASCVTSHLSLPTRHMPKHCTACARGPEVVMTKHSRKPTKQGVGVWLQQCTEEQSRQEEVSSVFRAGRSLLCLARRTSEEDRGFRAGKLLVLRCVPLPSRPERAEQWSPSPDSNVVLGLLSLEHRQTLLLRTSPPPVLDAAACAHAAGAAPSTGATVIGTAAAERMLRLCCPRGCSCGCCAGQ